MPWLIAWVASVWRSWCGVTLPIPAAWAAFATASPTRCLLIRRPRSMNRYGSRRPAGRLATHSSSSVFELGVQGDVAVGAELSERNVQPVRGADLHDRVDGQIEELAFAQPGPGEELDRQPSERVGVLASGAQQLCGRGVVDEARAAADRGAGCHRRTSARGRERPRHPTRSVDSRDTRSVPSCSASPMFESRPLPRTGGRWARRRL